MPLAGTCARFSADTSADTVTIGWRWPALRIARAASMPDMPGMWQSMSTRSGAVACTLATASSPLAGMTTSQPRSRSIASASVRLTGWSSTTSTRRPCTSFGSTFGAADGVTSATGGEAGSPTSSPCNRSTSAAMSSSDRSSCPMRCRSRADTRTNTPSASIVMRLNRASRGSRRSAPVSPASAGSHRRAAARRPACPSGRRRRSRRPRSYARRGGASGRRP